MPVIIEKFDEINPFSIEKVNKNFAAIVAVINTALGNSQLQFGTTPTSDPTHLPISGGTLLGQLTAPSIYIGPAGGAKYEPITTNNTATPIKAGILKQAANIAELAQVISATPTQEEVQALSDGVDALIAALVSSEIMSATP